MLWDLHAVTIEGTTNDPALQKHWQHTFASRPASIAAADLSITLDLVDAVPTRPSREPQFRQGDLLEYTIDGQIVIAYFPRYGQLRLDLAHGTTHGQIVQTALSTYGVFEDLVAIGLSPHLRRHGLFLIHAFAAVLPHADRGALLVGSIGAGKTTTGMALLNAGWRLLSNDSPIINASAEVLSYPGLLAAYPETYARFESTAHLASNVATDERRKITIAAESIQPDVWCDRVSASAIFFLQIESRSDHAVERLGSPEALRRLLPHAVEQWDKAMIPEHLTVLRHLVESTKAYILHLGPDVAAIPSLLASLL